MLGTKGNKMPKKKKGFPKILFVFLVPALGLFGILYVAMNMFPVDKENTLMQEYSYMDKNINEFLEMQNSFKKKYQIQFDLQELSKDKIDFTGGKTYGLDLVTGKGKVDLQGDQADYTDFFGLLLANYEDNQISTERSLEIKLEKHCERGFQVLASSLNENSDIYEWMKHEFL